MERGKADEKVMPDWSEPMLAKLTHDYFSGEDWIFEGKLNGERVPAYISPDGDVRLMSRNEKRLNDSYPEIQNALSDPAVSGCMLPAVKDLLKAILPCIITFSTACMSMGAM